MRGASRRPCGTASCASTFRSLRMPSPRRSPSAANDKETAMGITEKITALMGPRDRQPRAEAQTQRSDVLTLHDDFDRWLQRFLDDTWSSHPLGASGSARTPNVDVRDEGNAIVVRAELPGLNK